MRARPASLARIWPFCTECRQNLIVPLDSSGEAGGRLELRVEGDRPGRSRIEGAPFQAQVVELDLAAGISPLAASASGSLPLGMPPFIGRAEIEFVDCVP